jgi:hypothetical protein
MNSAAFDMHQPPRCFDDDVATALFKVALITNFCRNQISRDEVELIFARTPALKSA